MTRVMFVHNICPNSPKKKDNLQCVEDIELKVLMLIRGGKKGNYDKYS